jgi:hypothetical protein
MEARAKQITKGGGREAKESPDGRFLYYMSRRAHTGERILDTLSLHGATELRRVANPHLELLADRSKSCLDLIETRSVV